MGEARIYNRYLEYNNYYYKYLYVCKISKFSCQFGKMFICMVAVSYWALARTEKFVSVQWPFYGWCVEEGGSYWHGKLTVTPFSVLCHTCADRVRKIITHCRYFPLACQWYWPQSLYRRKLATRSLSTKAKWKRACGQEQKVIRYFDVSTAYFVLFAPLWAYAN